MKQNNPSEFQEQCSVIEWSKFNECTKPELKLLHASLNGVKLTIGQAVKAKRMGMKRGVPDLFLPVKRGKYSGLYIEMKSAKGVLSDEQKEWILLLTKQDYLCIVCYSASEAISAFQGYLVK